MEGLTEIAFVRVVLGAKERKSLGSVSLPSPFADNPLAEEAHKVLGDARPLRNAISEPPS